jgi:hypothetical protein
MSIMGGWQLWSRRRRREDADRDGRWEALAHTLAQAGFWSGLSSA